MNVIFILCGNCRTFIDCIDSCCDNVISKLFIGTKCNIYVYLYLKLTDPGPKGHGWGWDFTYSDVKYEMLINKINEIKDKHKNIFFEYKILNDNEISDTELLSQVKDRTKFIEYYSVDSFFIRGLQCHYNFESCGKYILEKEKSIENIFNYIIYIRPDLYFIKPCNTIDTYDNSSITVNHTINNIYLIDNPLVKNNDTVNHTVSLAIIPREHFVSFFFDRMKIYRNNTTHNFTTFEDVYFKTIKFNVKDIGVSFVKRP